MYYWARWEEVALLPDIEKWEKLTEWAQTNETVSLAIEQHKKSLLSSYSAYNLGILLECAFDRIVIFTDGQKEIAGENLNENKQAFDVYCIGWYAYIEI